MSSALDSLDPDYPLGGPEQIQTAWQLLAGGAPKAAKALIAIASHGKSEIARVQASSAILDRVGLIGKPEVQIAVVPQQFLEQGASSPESLVEIVRKRLEVLATPTVIDDPYAPLDVILDGEIVSDDDDGIWP